MKNGKRESWGEYGGKPGAPHRTEDGHDTLTPAEGRRVLATYGIRGADIPDGGVAVVNQGIDPATGEKWVDEHQAEKAARYKYLRDDVLNGREVGDVL
jgi:hypothetical protein